MFLFLVCKIRNSITGGVIKPMSYCRLHVSSSDICGNEINVYTRYHLIEEQGKLIFDVKQLCMFEILCTFFCKPNNISPAVTKNFPFVDLTKYL